MARSSKRKKTQAELPSEDLSEDEQQLWKDRRKWFAPVYDHFQPAQILRDEKGEKVFFKGEPRYVFVCKKYVSIGYLKKVTHYVYMVDIHHRSVSDLEPTTQPAH